MLQGGEIAYLLTEKIEFRFDILMEDTVFFHLFIYNRGGEEWHDTSKTFSGNEQFGSHYLIAKADGFTKKLLIVAHRHQTLSRWIA